MNFDTPKSLFLILVPFDISENTLKLAGEQLIKKYNGVEVFLHIGDYTRDISKLEDSQGGRLWLFLGSTLGNFSHDEGVVFLSNIAKKMHISDTVHQKKF